MKFNEKDLARVNTRARFILKESRHRPEEYHSSSRPV